MSAASGCASGWLGVEGSEVDAIFTNGGDGSGAAGWIKGSELGGGGDGVGEWSGVIELVEVWSSGGLSIWEGESRSENSWSISRFMSSIFSSYSPPIGLVASGWGLGLVGMMDVT